MAAKTGPGEGPGPRTDTEPARPRRPRNGAAGLAALAAGRIADGLVDPRVLLAWFLAFVGAPGLVGLLVPVREGGALLARRLAARVIGPGGSRWTRPAAHALQGLAALGIPAAGLFLWGATAGWTILGLLLLVALADGLASAGPLPGPAPRRIAGAIGAVAVLAFALVLALGLGPRGALIIWALMAAGGLWLLAALLVALLERPAAPATGAVSGRPRAGDARRRRPALAGILLVPAALAPPYMVALVSANPGRGLAALGGLLLASALARVAGLALLASSPPRRRAGAAGLAAAALALAGLADAAGWLLATPWLLPALVFAVVAADAAAGPGSESAAPEGGDAAAGTPTALALLAGALFAPLAAAIGPAAVLLLLAALLALAVPAALRLDAAEPPAEGA